MVIGSATTNLWGLVFGYMSNARYGGAANGGTITYQYLRDIRDPANPKSVRIAGILFQQNNYIVVDWEPVAGVPDPNWPPFTNKLQINGGTTYNFTSAAAAGVDLPNLGKYVVIGNTLPWNSATVGNTVNLAFI